MNGLKRVLVAVDFSDCAWDVCQRAVEIAAPAGAEVILAHVSELPAGVPREARIEHEGATRTAGQLLRDEAHGRLGGYDALFRERGLTVQHHVTGGPIADALLAAIEETGADHVVMGTHGRTGVSRAVLGSVAEKVVRRSPVPVTTVRTVYKPSCQASSCAWCTTHVQPEQSRVADESMG